MLELGRTSSGGCRDLHRGDSDRERQQAGRENVSARIELDQELYRGVEELRGLSKANFAQHQFFLFETRRGIEQHVILATTIGDYILEVVVCGARREDGEAPGNLGRAFGVLPAVEPSRNTCWRTASLTMDLRSRRIAWQQLEAESAGEADRSRKDQWRLLRERDARLQLSRSARLGAEAGRRCAAGDRDAIASKEDFGRPRIGRSEHILMDACSRTLFSAWAKRSGC